MQIDYGNKFLKSVQKLPINQQIKLDSLLERFSLNPYNPLLQRPLPKSISTAISKFWT